MFAGSRLLLPVLTNFITLVPKTREEGGTRCQRALAAEGDRGAEEIGQQEVAETGEWRRCRSLPFTPPASLHSHGSRPRPTRHSI